MSRPFEDELRTELMESIRRPRRRRGPTGIVALAITAVLAVGFLSLARPDHANADVEISRSQGRVQVLLTDLATSADDVRSALADEGLDVSVEEAPVGPSNVGRFVGESTNDADIDDVRRVSEVGVAFMGFSIPDDWEGTLTVLLGRPANEGETYQLFSDAYAAGEPLACTGTLGRPLSTAIETFAGAAVSVRADDGSPTALTDLDTALRAGHGTSIVTSALARAADDLLVTVSARPADVPEEPAC